FQVFDLAFHAIPRPQWRVRWGEVDHYDPKNPLSYALACADTNAKIIIVDRRYYAHRSTEDLIETIFHEWTHVMHPGESHGEKSQKTLASVRAYLNDLKQHPTPRAPIVERPGYLPSRPVDTKALVDATKGRQFAGAGRWGAPIHGGGEWEYR